MSPATEQILLAAMALPPDERQELVEVLLVGEHPPFDARTLIEIRRRSAEIEEGSVALTPWSVVRERVRRRVEGLPRD